MKMWSSDWRFSWLGKVVTEGLGLSPVVFREFSEVNGEALREILEGRPEEAFQPAKVVFFFDVQEEEEVEVDLPSTSGEKGGSESESEGEDLECASSSSEEGKKEDEEDEEDENEQSDVKVSTPVSSYEEDLASTYLDYSSSYITTGREISEFTGSINEMDKVSTISGEIRSEAKLPSEDLNKKKIVKQLVSKTVLRMCTGDACLSLDGQSVFYLMRTTHLGVHYNNLESDFAMDKVFQVGFLNAFMFNGLKEVIGKLCLPLSEKSSFDQQANYEVSVHRKEMTQSMRHFDSYLSEVLENFVPFSLEDFENHLQHEGDDNQEEEFYSEVTQLEDIICKWELKLKTLLREEALEMQVQSESLLSETVTLWQNRRSRCHLLAECLNKTLLPRVEALILLQKDSERLMSFRILCEEFGRYVSRLDRTVKVLRILYQAANEVQECSDSPCTKEMICEVLESLFSLTFFSSFFRDPSNMSPLVQQISRVLCNRALLSLRTEAVFSKPFHEIRQRISQASELLLHWKSCCSQVYDSFCTTVGSSSWNFHLESLWKQTDYVGSVLDELQQAINIAKDIGKISSKSKSLSSKSDEAKDHEQTVITHLLQCFNEADFDIYEVGYREQWRKVWKRFGQDCRTVKGDVQAQDSAAETKESKLDTQVSQLQMDSLQSLPVIQQLRLQEHTLLSPGNQIDDVLSRFMEEVSYLSSTTMEDDPLPLYEGFPTSSSQAFWLQARLALVQDGLADLEGVLPAARDSDLWTKVMEHVAVASVSLRDDQRRLFQKWQSAADSVSASLLKRSIFQGPGSAAGLTSSTVHSSVSARRAALISGSFASSSFGSKGPADEYFDVILNFPEELRTTIMEAKNFSQLGFQLSEQTQTLTLMENDLLRFEGDIRDLLYEYQNIRLSFTPMQLIVVDSVFNSIREAIQAGCRNYTWSSLSLPSYIDHLQKSIAQIFPLVSRLQLSFDNLEKCTETLQTFTAAFIESPEEQWCIYKSPQERCLDLQVSWTLDSMVKCQEKARQNLLRTEDLLFETRTGRHSRLRHLYNHWQQKIIDALLMTVRSNLDILHGAVTGSRPAFRTQALLLEGQLVIEPSVQDIYSSVMSTLHTVVHSSKKFFGWEPGTCLPSSDLATSTFYREISGDSEVNDLCVRIEVALSGKMADLLSALVLFRSYKYLWTLSPEETDLGGSSELLPSALHGSTTYAEKLQFLNALQFEISEVERHVNLGFVSLSLEPLLLEVGGFIQRWTRGIGDRLATSLHELLAGLWRDMMDLEKGLSCVPKSESEFKDLLLILAKISKMIDSVENSLKIAQESYHTLVLFKVKFSKDDNAKICKLEEKWQHLLSTARQLSHFVLEIEE